MRDIDRASRNTKNIKEQKYVEFQWLKGIIINYSFKICNLILLIQYINVKNYTPENLSWMAVCLFSL